MGKEQDKFNSSKILVGGEAFNDEFKWLFTDNQWIKFRPANIKIRTSLGYLRNRDKK